MLILSLILSSTLTDLKFSLFSWSYQLPINYLINIISFLGKCFGDLCSYRQPLPLGSMSVLLLQSWGCGEPPAFLGVATLFKSLELGGARQDSLYSAHLTPSA